MDNPRLFDQLQSTLLNLELKRTDLLSKFAPTYPLVQAVDQQIAEAKNAIQLEESKPIREESSGRNQLINGSRMSLPRLRVSSVACNRGLILQPRLPGSTVQRLSGLIRTDWSNRTSCGLPRRRKKLSLVCTQAGRGTN
jgi:hypothetical protein